MRIPILVSLDERDWDVIETRTDMIVASHTKGAGRKDRNHRVDTSRDDRQIHRAGVLGELAFSKWSGLPLPKIEARGGDGNGPDFWFNRYEGINIKTTLPGRNLVPRKGSPLNATHYGLVWWDSETVDFLTGLPLKGEVKLVGWVERAELLDAGHMRDFKIGYQLFYPHESLEDFRELEERLAGGPWARREP